MADVRRAAGVAASTAAVVSCILPATPSVATTACSYFDFRASGYHSLTRMVRVDLPSGAVSDLGRLDHRVLAAGYSRAQDLVYAIVSGGLLRRPRLVTITRGATVTDLGEVRHGVGGLADAEAGAVVGSQFYVRDHLRLYTIDIGPGSPTYGRVVRAVQLPVVGYEVDDFGADPSSGVLYGVATWGRVAQLVTLSPATGAVRVVTPVAGIPWQDGYSSVVVSGSTVYAEHTGHGRASELYRIGLDGSSTKLASGPSLADTDAAGCLAPATPPPPPTSPPPKPPPTPPPPTPPPPPPPTPPPPPGTPTPTSTSRPTPTPRPTPTRHPTPAPPKPPSTPHPRPTQTPTPTPRPTSTPTQPDLPPPSKPPTRTPSRPAPVTDFAVAPQAAAAPKPHDRNVQVLRRWSLATLLVILSGGAAMAAQRRMRRRR
ncbi:DUF6923 family protein [Kribbella sp. NPDC004536]|uniref:DUF6923 family protein n=1 Tax=Kribbella sp. NPDC004536 TaxID=3364106 RepID=UPI0036AE3C24